jgi:hypothetical protein
LASSDDTGFAQHAAEQGYDGILAAAEVQLDDTTRGQDQRAA